MHNNSHTPGSWEYSGGGIWGKSPFGARVRLADITFHNSINGINAEANAVLLATAPELLKLLREVLQWNDDDADLATNDTAFRLKNFADTVSNRRAALKAAITKATGEPA